MIEYNENEKRMVLKLVYYGPAKSGKTTNLLRLHDILAREGRGDLMMLDTTDDRTIFFDLIPFFLVAPSGLKIKVKVYTVPGQVRHDATRKAVLQRCDGVVFVADSAKGEQANNLESLQNLEENRALVGLDIERLPLVVQFNKRDLPDIVSESEVEKRWGPTAIPVFMASALSGLGVVETFAGIGGLLFDSLDRRYFLEQQHGLTREEFLRRLSSPEEQ